MELPPTRQEEPIGYSPALNAGIHLKFQYLATDSGAGVLSDIIPLTPWTC